MDAWEILKALDRTDPAVGGFVTSCIALEQISDACDDVEKHHGTEIAKMLRQREAQFRREAGGTYVSSVSKSGQPSDRTFRLAAAADEAGHIAEDFEKAGGWETWWFGGQSQQRRVNRDNSGRFARVLGPNDTSDPTSGGWTYENQRNVGEYPNDQRTALPSNLQSQIQQDPQTGAVNWNQATPQATREDTERYLGQVKAVQKLVRELETMFPDARDDIEMNITVYDPSMGGQMNTSTIPVDSEQLMPNLEQVAGGPQQQIQQVTYGAGPDVTGQDYTQITGQLASKYGTSPNQITAPAQLQALGEALRPAKAGPEIPTAPTRLKNAMSQWGAVMQQIPDSRVQALGTFLTDSAEQTGRLAEDLRPGMLKQSFRFRGTRRAQVDPELEMQATGSQLKQAEALAFEEEAGRFNRQAAIDALGPEVQEDDQVKQLNEQLGAVERQLRDPVSTIPILELKAKQAELRAARDKAMSAAGTQRSIDRKALSDKDPAYGSNWAYNALKTRRNVDKESGLAATMGAQRDAASFFFIKQMIEEAAGRRGADRGRRRPGDPNASITDTDLDRLTAEIAANLGQGFPSEGVMFDRNGKIDSQSIGAGEDHYLPFDLGSYKKLMGGSYVRTRHTGGPTSEDLMALIAGTGIAGTVVSRSGVFTIEMDQQYIKPTRVARMAKTYERILNQVAHGGLYLNQPDPLERAKQEKKLLNNKKYREDPQAFDTAMDQWVFDTRRKQAAEAATDPKAISRRAKELASQDGFEQYGKDSRITAKYDRAAAKEIREDAERKLMINGEGYEVALKTLQRYFPYAIKKVERYELRDFVKRISGDAELGEDDAMLAGAAGAISTRGPDKFRVDPVKAGGGPYSGGETALKPSYTEPKTEKRPGSESTTTGGAGATSGTNARERGTTSSETSSEESSGSPAERVSVTEVINDDPTNGSVTRAREQIASTITSLVNDYDDAVPSTLFDESKQGGKDIQDALGTLAGHQRNSDTYNALLLSEGPEAADAAFNEAVESTLFARGSNRQNLARVAALQFLTGYANLDEDQLSSILQGLAGVGSTPESLVNLYDELTNKDAMTAFGRKFAFDGQDPANNGLDRTVAMANSLFQANTGLLARLDWLVNEPVVSSGASPSSEFNGEGKPLLFDSLETATPADVKKLNALYNVYPGEAAQGMEFNDVFPTIAQFASNVVNLKAQGIENADRLQAHPRLIMDQIIDQFYGKDASGSGELAGQARTVIGRMAATVLTEIAEGQSGGTSKFANGVKKLFDIKKDDPREDYLRALADAAVLDYSVTSRLAGLEWGDDPAKKVQAGSRPASNPQPQQTPPFPANKLPMAKAESLWMEEVLPELLAIRSRL